MGFDFHAAGEILFQSFTNDAVAARSCHGHEALMALPAPAQPLEPSPLRLQPRAPFQPPPGLPPPGALPGHGPCWARPTHGLMSQPGLGLSLSPSPCPVSGAGAAPEAPPPRAQVLARAWVRPGCQTLPGCCQPRPTGPALSPGNMAVDVTWNTGGFHLQVPKNYICERRKHMPTLRRFAASLPALSCVKLNM